MTAEQPRPAVVALIASLFVALVPAAATERAPRAIRSLTPAPAPVPPLRPAASLPSASTPEPPRSAADDGTCLAALRAVYGDRIGPAPAIKAAASDLQCQVADPVRVEAIALDDVSIVLAPPVTLSCAMAGKVALWLKTSVRPLTRGYFGAELLGLHVGGGQECRRRNRAATGPVSEHATGRALDIFAFETAGPNATRIVVEKPDGTLQRDYLLALRHSACGQFSTSLGPGADTAHADHIHVDIQMRRSQASKFCE